MANEDVDEAHTDLRLPSPFPLDGPSFAIPLSHEAATPDLPRTPPQGEGHLPDPEPLGHLQIPGRNSSSDREADVGLTYTPSSSAGTR
jgi:hypothetical protein